MTKATIPTIEARSTVSRKKLEFFLRFRTSRMGQQQLYCRGSAWLPCRRQIQPVLCCSGVGYHFETQPIPLTKFSYGFQTRPIKNKQTRWD